MTKEKKGNPERNKNILSILDRYLVDLECLREMNSNVVPFLREKDRERSLIVKQILKRAKINGKDKEETILDGPETDEKVDTDETKDKIKKTISLTFKDSDAEVFMSNVGKLRRAEQLFEKQVTVTLVSRFDEFLGDLLRVVLIQNPSWLRTSEKTITYKDLIELKSIDKAIEGVIYKEVENLLRGSHKEQISYIDEKLKLGISDNFEKLPDFLEVAERRNLFVHTGGLVSQQYLDKCNEFKCEIKGVNLGDCLGSDSEYFNKAFLVFFEIGLRIAQAAYRRLFPSELEAADRALNSLAIKFLKDGEYNLAEIITEFDLGIPDKLRSKEPEYQYYARINRAVSQKFSGKEFEKGLEGVPWNVFHTKYAMCLHVIRDEFQDAAKLMKSAEISSSIGQEGLRTWPIFREFRESEEFRETYKELYGEEYSPDLKQDVNLNSGEETVC